MSKYFELFCLELKMGVLARWRYKMNMIGDIVIMVGIFVMVFFLQSDYSLANHYHLSIEKNGILLFIGYLFWQFASLSLGFSTSIISSESSEGVLEVKMQSTYDIVLLLFMKLLVCIISNLVIFTVLIIIFPLFASISIQDIFFFLLIAILNIPSIVGMFGIGLIISSFIVKEKKGSNLVLIIQALLIFVSNVTRPLQSSIIQLIPFGVGIEISRNLYSGISVSIQQILTYIFLNIVWLILGVLLFNRSLDRVKKIGTFDTY